MSIAIISNTMTQVQYDTTANDRLREQQALLDQARLQANELKAITDNILQLNEQLAQHTQHTEQASQHALNTSTMVAHGELMMNDVHAAMSDITGRTKEMTEAIGMIENVAFQTHILSLNVTIEAARAGELGRGFAVVAREVGTLAAQSSQSAQHINVLIRDPDSSVATGAKLVKKLSDNLQNIISSAQGTGAFLNDIADISSQQTQHIQAVTDHIQTLNGTVKQNVSQVEASADTFNSLLAQTEQLRASVTLFTLPTPNSPERG
ncbi:MAG: methyl-accepting chemotaxis protein [Symbiopectobacterium sp.]|uniref:methyl-accepting chemotaxis protein n=1 Tax=Symbiopectobacterium sp. TaxID=2952789 RepID=UPI0039EA806D